MSNPRLATLECERRRGVSFAENFVSEDRLALNDGVITGSGAIVARGVTLDGTQHIDFDVIPQALPASAVVRFSAVSLSEGILIGNANLIAGVATDGFCVWSDADGIKATYSDGATIETALGVDVDYADGETHTVTYVLSATYHTLYVDDETAATAVTTTAGPIGATLAVYVGGDGTDNFEGTIYRPRIFDATLTAGEHALYHTDTLETFVDDALAVYGCDTFGDDTDGDRVWDNKDSDLDLIKGDGSTSSTFPTFVNDTDHLTQYYTFDGVNDYLSNWPTMPAAYTVSALLSTDYPGGVPYVSQVNDSTVKDLLTVSGAFTGNLHSLMIFTGALELLQLYHIEFLQKKRVWRETVVSPSFDRLLREDIAVQMYKFEDPEHAGPDFSSIDTVATINDMTWAQGMSCDGSNSNLVIPDEAGLRLDRITIHVSATDMYDGVMVHKGNNYDFRVSISGTRATFRSRIYTHTTAAEKTMTVTCINGEKPQFYFDGSWVGEGNSTATMVDTDTDDLSIGNLLAGGEEFNADTAIRSVTIVNDILTPAEIRVLHNVTAGVPDYSGGSPVINDVDGDDLITGTQTDVVVDCDNAGAVEGTLYLCDSPVFGFATVVVEQPIDNWSDTSIQFDVDPGAL